MGLLSGKVAVITGASRGIGRAVALKFASEGADIAFTYLEQKDLAEQTEAEIRAMGVKCQSYAADASNYQLTKDVVAEIHKEFGRIDVLVNNAGITRDALVFRMNEEQWDEVLRVNLKSAFNFTNAVAPIMTRQRSGSIINMSSIVGIGGNFGQSNYAASKAALIGLAKSVAKELGARGIRSNCVAPGFIISDMTDRLPDSLKNEWIEDTPMRRGGSVEEVAGAALFLASDLSSFVTGQVIRCDGGYHM
ncbi:MAG: 3-oxoacyl-[Bacteroidales bacterium]|nr:3-oxoacyl-[acyl-carrier-protein] reductase [Bacteroidales bacterium]MBQ1937708.1 3-oxoacyl-[acyl-carrier-protein] reductase [Bacteroidales bacterium]MBQ2452200.1 3-oxoacyl-[acyl-carrier-protein] reductase [Bacteroidales bacterium]